MLFRRRIPQFLSQRTYKKMVVLIYQTITLQLAALSTCILVSGYTCCFAAEQAKQCQMCHSWPVLNNFVGSYHEGREAVNVSYESSSPLYCNIPVCMTLIDMNAVSAQILVACSLASCCIVNFGSSLLFLAQIFTALFITDRANWRDIEKVGCSDQPMTQSQGTSS